MPATDKTLNLEDATLPMPEPNQGGQSESQSKLNGTNVSFKISKGTYMLATEYIKTVDKDTLGTKWDSLEEYLEYVCYELLAKGQTAETK